jgi:hypothetical protein
VMPCPGTTTPPVPVDEDALDELLEDALDALLDEAFDAELTVLVPPLPVPLALDALALAPPLPVADAEGPPGSPVRKSPPHAATHTSHQPRIRRIRPEYPFCCPFAPNGAIGRGMRPWYVLMPAIVGLCACAALPQGPMERLNGAASDLNVATRFGRMDIAAGNVAADSRADFGRRHKAWGRDVRVLDVELEGVQILPDGGAEVDVTISWHRVDETVIRTTAVAQRWVQDTNDWKLVDETIAGGSPGLFPAKAKKKIDKPASEKEALRGAVDVP